MTRRPEIPDFLGEARVERERTQRQLGQKTVNLDREQKVRAVNQREVANRFGESTTRERLEENRQSRANLERAYYAREERRIGRKINQAERRRLRLPENVRNAFLGIAFAASLVVAGSILYSLHQSDIQFLNTQIEQINDQIESGELDVRAVTDVSINKAVYGRVTPSRHGKAQDNTTNLATTFQPGELEDVTEIVFYNYNGESDKNGVWCGLKIDELPEKIVENASLIDELDDCEYLWVNRGDRVDERYISYNLVD